MTLNPKALKAAVDALWHHSPPGSDINLAPAIRAYLDAADLVPFTDGVAVRERMSQELELAQIQARQDRRERDKARAQVAALREALDNIADHAPWGGPDITDWIKWMQGVARAALTDTEEAPTEREPEGEDGG